MPDRDPWLDNAKAVFVTLAVVGHCWSMLPAGHQADRAYDFLYAWHMPALVLVTGYLSRNFTWSRSRLRSLLTTVVLPYLVFSAALGWFEVMLGWTSREHWFLVPMWPMWYLMALAFWRLAVPAVRRLPAPAAVAASVVVSLLGGTIDYPYLDLPRVTGLLPFFVLGAVATPENLAMVRGRAVQALGGVALALTFLVVVDHLDDWAGTPWLYFKSYGDLGVTDVHGMLVRGFLLVVALGCSLGALSLVPAARHSWSRVGAATMIVFLFHGFVVRAADEAGFETWAAAHPALAPLVVVVAAVGMSRALASPLAVRLLDPLVDPVGHLRAARRTRSRDEHDARATPTLSA